MDQLLAAVAIPKAPQARKSLHDCPPSKQPRDTIPLYQEDVARHRVSIASPAWYRVGLKSNVRMGYVRYWPKADIPSCMSAFGGKADIKSATEQSGQSFTPTV